MDLPPRLMPPEEKSEVCVVYGKPARPEWTVRTIGSQTQYYLPCRGSPDVCAGDLDNDSDLDLVFPGESGARLYENDGSGGFTFRNGPIGPDRTAGCLLFDANGDGALDFLLTGIGAELYLQTNPLEFEEDEQDELDVSCIAFSSTVGDIDFDGDLDFVIGCYLEGECRSAASNIVFRNNDGHFSSERLPGASATYVNLLIDFDRDGDLDYFQGNDGGRFMPNRLFLNDGRGGLQDYAPEFGLDFGRYADGSRDSADVMGVEISDLDNDTVLEITVSNFALRPTLLIFDCERREGGDIFCPERAQELGISVRNATGWGVLGADLDNDGDRDLIEVMADSVDPKVMAQGVPENVRNYFFWNDEGRFSPEAFGTAARGYGLAAGDFDGDGDIDFAVNYLYGRPEIWINGGAENSWISVDLRCQEPNVFYVGARVRAVAEGICEQELDRVSGGSFAGNSFGPMHFGLGSGEEARVSVIWPSGRGSDFGVLPAGQVLLLEEVE